LSTRAWRHRRREGGSREGTDCCARGRNRGNDHFGARPTASDDQFGTVHFPISCTAVQEKFDRAVALLHNFFYPETVRAFQALIAEDPNCEMQQNIVTPAKAGVQGKTLRPPSLDSSFAGMTDRL
jgi:hypothetical protein